MTSPEPRWEELDPFRSVADPDTYVARAATERALQELTSALQQDAGGALVLLGPAGIGKSMVLKLLVNRLADAYTFACVPTAGASAEELAEMALDVLKDVRGDDPVGALAASSERLAAAGRPLVLAIDLADAPADDGLTQLAPRLAAEAPRLHLLLVATERVGLEPLLEGLGPRLQRVRLVAPMSQDETAAYIESRLERGSTELGCRKGREAPRRLRRKSGSLARSAESHAARALVGGPSGTRARAARRAR
jgi:general secretion pathway protein A